MPATIITQRRSAVAEPGASVQFALRALRNGDPLAGAQVTVQVLEGEVAVTSLEPTGNDGRFGIVLSGLQTTCRARIRVAVEDAQEELTLFVTNLDIDAPRTSLTAVERELLRMLYWQRERIRVVREFGGGASGSRVLQVEPIEHGAALATEVVKIGSRDDMLQEADNYGRLLKGRLFGRAAPVREDEATGVHAAVVYGDVGSAAAVAPLVSLGEYFASQSRESILATLYSIFDRGLRSVYRYHTVRTETGRRLLGRFLPENLLVSLSGRPGLGIHKAAQGSVPDGARIITEHDFDSAKLQVPDGSTVVLRDFPIRKLQRDDLNLEDAGKRRYKVKVRFDGAVPEGLATNDRVDIVARVIADRRSRLDFAITHCLQACGGERTRSGWLLAGERFPDPAALLVDLLDDKCDVAVGTIHGDLHWENLILSGPDNWWLIDYGLTCEGPILFDFIKLETYLRYTEFLKLPDLTLDELVQFELALLDNPLGELRFPTHWRPELDKAGAAITAIRRYARRYVVDDMFDYWRLLFIYSVAIAKYYPSEDRWSDIDGQLADREQRKLRSVLVLALTLGRLVALQNGKVPDLQLEFTGLGQLLDPVDGKVALDVGSRCEPGIVDHHLREAGADGEEFVLRGQCATTLVLERPGLVDDHIAGRALDGVTWVLHERPDFDCLASLYLAWHRARYGFVPAAARRLADYALLVDAGAGFLDDLDEPERSPYALFQTYQRLGGHRQGDDPAADRERVRLGWQVLQYVCAQEAVGEHVLVTNQVPHGHPFWEASNRDRLLFEKHDTRNARRFTARVHVGGVPREVGGLVMVDPRSVLFKTWARRAGRPLLIVQWPQPDKPHHRIVISVPPQMREALRGLGRALELREMLARGEPGCQKFPLPSGEPDAAATKLAFAPAGDANRQSLMRGLPPRWSDVCNSDPWYDGRAPVHAYTIVDSPRIGTLLNVQDIVDVVINGDWIGT